MALLASEKPALQPQQQQQQQNQYLDVDTHDPEKNLARLSPVPSATSTVESALDAEAGLGNEPSPGTPVTTKDHDADDPGPPPNGGFKAWLQVAGSFFLFFNCWYVFSSLSKAKGGRGGRL